MTKEDKLQKLYSERERLKERLDIEMNREIDIINRQGWGYGMRHTKIGVSTSKSDRIRNRIEKIEKQIRQLEENEKDNQET